MFNRATIIGHLGKDPEIRRTQDGRPIANLRIATSEHWKDKTTGEKREKTEWHSVVIFNEALTKVAEQYLKKGAKVLIEGKLQTRKWTDQQGVERYSTEIVLNNFDAKLIMLERAAGSSKARDEGDSWEGDAREPDRKPAGGSYADKKSGGESKFDKPINDEIPF